MKKTTSTSVIRYIDETSAQVTKAFKRSSMIWLVHGRKGSWTENKDQLTRQSERRKHYENQ